VLEQDPPVVTGGCLPVRLAGHVAIPVHVRPGEDVVLEEVGETEGGEAAFAPTTWCPHIVNVQDWQSCTRSVNWVGKRQVSEGEQGDWRPRTQCLWPLPFQVALALCVQEKSDGIVHFQRQGPSFSELRALAKQRGVLIASRRVTVIAAVARSGSRWGFESASWAHSRATRRRRALPYPVPHVLQREVQRYIRVRGILSRPGLLK